MDIYFFTEKQILFKFINIIYKSVFIDFTLCYIKYNLNNNTYYILLSLLIF